MVCWCDLTVWRCFLCDFSKRFHAQWWFSRWSKFLKCYQIFHLVYFLNKKPITNTFIIVQHGGVGKSIRPQMLLFPISIQIVDLYWYRKKKTCNIKFPHTVSQGVETLTGCEFCNMFIIWYSSHCLSCCQGGESIGQINFCCCYFKG